MAFYAKFFGRRTPFFIEAKIYGATVNINCMAKINPAPSKAGCVGCELIKRRVAVPTNKEERVSDVPMNESEQVTD